ncbi:hypothetical protein HN51_012020, partial [Arachis hypogaea]
GMEFQFQGKANLVHYVGWLGKEEEVTGELVHLCLFYFSRQLLLRDEKQHDLDGSRFEFKVDDHSYVDNGRLCLEVKNWEMRVRYFSIPTKHTLGFQWVLLEYNTGSFSSH